MLIRIFFTLFLSLTWLSTPLSAQVVRLCFNHSAGPGQTDTLQLYLKSTTPDSVAIRGVNLSYAFHDSCATYRTLFGLVSDTWGTFFEDTIVLHNLNLNYGGQTYDSRLQYGNSDPSLMTPKVIYAPPVSDSALLVMSLVFEGSCASQVYPEHESENPVNQLGDINHNRIDYVLESCIAMPTALDPGVALHPLQGWPIPAQEQLFFSPGPMAGKTGKVRLLSVEGRLWREQALPAIPGTDAHSVDLRGLPSGFYLLEIIPQSQEIPRQWIKFVKH